MTQAIGYAVIGFVVGFVVAAAQGDRRVSDQKRRFKRTCDLCRSDDIYENQDNWGAW